MLLSRQIQKKLYELEIPQSLTLQNGIFWTVVVTAISEAKQ